MEVRGSEGGGSLAERGADLQGAAEAHEEEEPVH